MYNYYVQEEMGDFWLRLGTAQRRALFIFGLGFDPRCVPGIRRFRDLFQNADLATTFCARFTNLHDSNLGENLKGTHDSLSSIRSVRAGFSKSRAKHYEVEVNLFDGDYNAVGDELLIREFDDCLGGSLSEYTDIIVDISAFPRSMMYTLLSHIWNIRAPGQNLFAVITRTSSLVGIEQDSFVDASYIRGDRRVRKFGPHVWLPVLGGDVDRLDTLYEFLRPSAVFPIVPFPERDARRGDEVLLRSRRFVFDKWGVPTDNILYASGAIPWDVMRKIVDFADVQSVARPGMKVAVSGMSGRTLSLGVLVAALWRGLYICHVQPTGYAMTAEARLLAEAECKNAEPRLFWLAGTLYDGLDEE